MEILRRVICVTALVPKYVCCAKRKKEQVIKVVVLGTKGAGKSTVCLRLSSHKQKVPVAAELGAENHLPYKNFEVKNIKNTTVKICEINGGAGPATNVYLSKAHGLVYVLDSSDQKSIEEAKQTLETLYNNEFLSGKPTLLIANKVDQITPKEYKRLIKTLFKETLDVPNLSKNNGCPTKATFLNANDLRDAELFEAAEAWIRTFRKKLDQLEGKCQEDKWKASSMDIPFMIPMKKDSASKKFARHKRGKVTPLMLPLETKDRAVEHEEQSVGDSCDLSSVKDGEEEELTPTGDYLPAKEDENAELKLNFE